VHDQVWEGDEMTTENIGPFAEYYRIMVDGYLVPKITAVKIEENLWNITLDERYGITAPGEEIQKWMWIVANAMAIGAGYSCFGENSQIINQYSIKAIGLSQEELDIIKDNGTTKIVE